MCECSVCKGCAKGQNVGLVGGRGPQPQKRCARGCGGFDREKHDGSATQAGGALNSMFCVRYPEGLDREVLCSAHCEPRRAAPTNEFFALEKSEKRELGNFSQI